MLLENRSPLPPMRLIESPEKALLHIDCVGAAIDMMRHMKWHSRLSVGTMVPLIMNALSDGRAHFMLTPDQRPLGFAVWHWTDDATHSCWLATPPTLEEIGRMERFSGGPENQTLHLWFSLLITPFCSCLPLMYELQQKLYNARRAWGITPYGINTDGIDIHATPQFRTLW